MLWLANSKKRSYIIHSLTPEQRKVQIMDVFSIENKYGSLIIYSGQKPTLGLQAFAEYYRQLTGCVYVTNEKQFYIYNRQNGLWEQQSPEKLISKISEEIFKLAQEEAIEGEFASMRRPTVIREILVFLSALAPVSGDFFKKRSIWIHCLNGVVEFENGRWVLKPFSPDYHSRNRCNLVYDSSAQCPRFKEQLLAPLLENEDIDLLQKYFNAWCVKDGFKGYLGILRAMPEGSDFAGAENIRSWMGVRNVLSCESHHDLLRNCMYLVEKEQTVQAEEYMPEILRFQNPEWVYKEV